MEFTIDEDRERVDRAFVWGFLSTAAYWARTRTRDVLESQIDRSWRVVGAYEPHSGRMIGFARAVSDGGSTAYLADVFVSPDVQGNGVGKALLHAMIEDGPGKNFRWMLHTKDAHGLYRQFGFGPPDETYLERPKRFVDSD